MIGELIFDFALMVFLGVFYAVSFTFKASATAGDTLGAVGYPRLIIILAFVLLAYEAYQVIKKRKAAAGTQQEAKTVQNYKRLLLCLVIVVGYLIALGTLGYALSTFACMFLLCKAIGFRKNLSVLIFSILATAAVVLVFGSLFSISLPRGIGFLKELSFYIY